MFLNVLRTIVILFYHFVFFFSWSPEAKFPFSRVFLPPKEAPKTEFTEKQDVEVYSRANVREDCGWWTAKVQVCTQFLTLPQQSEQVRLYLQTIFHSTFH